MRFLDKLEMTEARTCHKDSVSVKWERHVRRLTIKIEFSEG